MKRKEDIQYLISKCEKKVLPLEEAYKNALHEQKIPVEIRGVVREILIDLRSVLDFLAHEIVETQKIKPPKKLYFPILADLKSFNSKMTEWYPNLDNINKPLFDYLLSIQPFSKGTRNWIKDFNTLNNTNKHDRIVPHERQEMSYTTTLLHEQPVGGVSWGKRVTSHGSIRVKGGKMNTKTQLPEPDSNIEVKKVTWIDFHFEGSKISAFELVKNAIKGINEIVKEVEKNINE